jgi:hypothetical protein
MALQKWFRRITICLATILLTIGGYFSQSNAQSTADQSLSARAVNADGVIEILHEDLTNNSSRYLYFLKTADGRRVRLHFAKHPPTNLLTGDHVSVHGSQSGVSMMLTSVGIVTKLRQNPASTACGAAAQYLRRAVHFGDPREFPGRSDQSALYSCHCAELGLRHG